MTNLTIAEWAKTLGISRQQGYAAIERCGITVTDGKVDPEYATILYHRHTRARANANQAAPQSPPPSIIGDAGDYQAARARREAAEASIAEMKEAEMRGKYLLKSDVDSAIFEIARAVRDGLTNCARRIAAEVAAINTAPECEAIIDREHRALLESMTHRLNAKLNVSAEGEQQ
jgi:hypothetical protein